MKVCATTREGLYQVLAAVFNAFDRETAIAELGVLRGENAERLQQVFAPESLTLVDSWSAVSQKAYSPFDELPSWVSPPETFAYYFGGSPLEQATWDRLYEECRQRFDGQAEVHLVRQDTHAAYEAVRSRCAGRGLDLLYVDASHQYEYVLRDLLTWQDLVRPDGVLMLNDACFSRKGAMQNLGVLEALGNFMKRSDFVPVAMTNTDFSDVVLVRKGSYMVEALDTALGNSDVPWVELPPQFITAARVVNGHHRANLSFV